MITWDRHGAAITWLLFTAVGVAVVAPWTSHGWLLLLDWSSGPRATLTSSAYGIDPSQVDAMPARLAIVGLRHLVGPRAAAWVAIAAVFPIGGAGAARLVGGRPARALSAGLLFVANPFVLDRVRVGHVLFLLGIALLPWALASFLAIRTSGRFRVRAAAWFALLVSVSPHLAWVAGVALLATLVWPRASWRDVGRVVATVAAAATVYAYGLALELAGVQTQHVGRADLVAFRTAGGSVLGRTANLVVLGGFWRAGRSPADALGPLWWVVAAAVALVIAVGARAGWRNPGHRSLLVTTWVAGGAGLLLAGGDAGLAGPLHRALFDHVALFAVMREPQKFLALTVLAYAVSFGFGADALADALAARPRLVRRVATACLLALPVLLVPNLWWGLGGEVHTSRYPAGWAAAEQAMGSGTEAVLFLPWHQYQPFAFTDGRTVATPAAAYFSRPVISGDDPELGGAGRSLSPRSHYVAQLLARRGRIHHLGRLVAPLGVRFVAAVPGHGDDRWLARQQDLLPEVTTDDLVVYRVIPSGTGRVDGAIVARDVDRAVELAETGTLGDAALLVGPAAPGRGGSSDDPFRTSTSTSTSSTTGTGTGGLVARNAVTYDLASGPAGWVVVPQPANAGWRIDQKRGLPTVSGVLAFPVGSEQAVVGYRPWRIVLGGYAVSALALLGLLGLGLHEHRKELTLLVERSSRSGGAS